ncbi:MAG: LapA family protein [Solirubrobacteraceae bacterium]
MTLAGKHPIPAPGLDEVPAGASAASAAPAPDAPVPAAPAPAASAASAGAKRVETRRERFSRVGHQALLHGYAIAIVAFIAVLVALAATNTVRVHVDWLVGRSRVSLVWLVLAAAIIGWILGVLASVRFQWLTRVRPHRTQVKTRSSKERRV